MLAQVFLEQGCIVPQHSHENEQVTWIVEGALRFFLGEDESEVIDVSTGCAAPGRGARDDARHRHLHTASAGLARRQRCVLARPPRIGLDPAMARFLIARSFDVTEPEMPPVGRKSRELVEGEFPEVTWEHSHVAVDDETGKVRTYCVYTAPSVDVVRDHSSKLGQHKIDWIEEIVGDVTPADFPPA